LQTSHFVLPRIHLKTAKEKGKNLRSLKRLLERNKQLLKKKLISLVAITLVAINFVNFTDPISLGSLDLVCVFVALIIARFIQSRPPRSEEMICGTNEKLTSNLTDTLLRAKVDQDEGWKIYQVFYAAMNNFPH
jgi:hypothetical protein